MKRYQFYLGLIGSCLLLGGANLTVAAHSAGKTNEWAVSSVRGLNLAQGGAVFGSAPAPKPSAPKPAAPKPSAPKSSASPRISAPRPATPRPSAPSTPSLNSASTGDDGAIVAGTPEADSLIQEGNALFKNAEQGSTTDALAAAEKFERAFQLFFTANNKKMMALAQYNYAASLYTGKDYANALPAYLKASEIYDELQRQSDRADALRGAAITARANTNPTESARLFKQAAEIYCAIESKQKECAVAYKDAYFSFRNMNDNQSALEMLGQSLTVTRKLNLRRDEIELLKYEGYTHKDLKDYGKAVEVFRQALEIVRAETPANPNAEAELLNQIGECFREAGDYERALESHNQALSIYQNNNNAGSVQRTQQLINAVKIKQGGVP